MPSSRIFSSYRALGYVSNHIPNFVRYVKVRQQHVVVTVMGRAFLSYTTGKMTLINISPMHDHDIECITADEQNIFSADRNVIKAWRRGTELANTYTGHTEAVHLMLVFGLHLISVDRGSNLKMWEIRSTDIYIELSFNNDSFCISAIVHPPTYLNKILLGSQQGTLQLWNVKSGLMIYNFSGWNSSVTVLEPAPAIDVIAVGLANGNIVIHNIKYDEILMQFVQEWGPITSLSFRTDGHPILASSGTQGHIALWNLENKTLQSQIRDAHKRSIAGINFLQDEPLLISNSSDNSIRMWILDLSDGGGRLLRFREGHSGAPTRIRFYGNDGKRILSADRKSLLAVSMEISNLSTDLGKGVWTWYKKNFSPAQLWQGGEDSTLRIFSTVHDMLHKNLGQASYNRALAKRTGVRYDAHKMTPITDFSAECVREKEWENVAAIHSDGTAVSLWSTHFMKFSDKMLQHTEIDSVQGKVINFIPTCTSVTHCGNYVLVGYKNGIVDMFNIQSGLNRGSYGEKKAHDGMVCGITSDSLNQVVVTVGIDKKVKFWQFKTKILINSHSVDYIVGRICLHRESSLLAMALDDYSLQILDMDTKRLARDFEGHTAKITDFTFRADGRWLLSASVDCSIRTWDIPAGRLIDCFMVNDVCTSLAMSPTGEFLATTHVDNVGIYLWVNHTLFTHVSLQPLPSNYTPQSQELPLAMTDDGTLLNEIGNVIEPHGDANVMEDVEFTSPEQIAKDLVTLSLAPESRWKNLLNMDIIKKRNKPAEPPKALKAAPFFLPTVPGLNFQFALPEKEKDGSRILTSVPFYTVTEFGRKLEQADTSTQYLEAMEMLKELGPAGVEIEVTNLAPEGGGSLTLMSTFLTMIITVLQTNRDFELAQAYLGLFLKLHGLTVAKDENLCKLCSTILECQSSAWSRIQNSFNRCECVVSFLKNAAL